MVSDSYGVLLSPQALVDKLGLIPLRYSASGRNSAVECQLPKLDVTGSIPVARSIFPSKKTVQIVPAVQSVQSDPFKQQPMLLHAIVSAQLVIGLMLLFGLVQ